MSHPGYLTDCHVDIHAVLLKVTFFRMSSELGRGRGKSLQNSCIDESSST